MLTKIFDVLRIRNRLVLGKGARMFATLTNGVEQRVPAETARVLTATTTLTADDSGATLFLASATEFVTTLPAPFLNGRFTFIVSAAPSGASYTIVTAASANVIKGQVLTLDVNSATDPDFEVTSADTITLVDGKSVAGDRVDMVSDGTTWFAVASCSVFDAITYTTAS